MRYDQYDEVTVPPSDAQILLNRPSTTDATYVHGTPARITPPNLLAAAAVNIPRIMFFGTSNVSGLNTVEGGERWTDKVCASLHAEQVNYGATGAILAMDETGSNGGYVTVWNALTPRVADAGAYDIRHGAPYVPLSPVVVLDYGYNDMVWLNATLATSLTWWEMATQACCCIARAGGWFPDTDASVAYSATWSALTNQQQYGWPTSHSTSTVGQTATITVPADFPGGEVCIFTVAYQGGAKWSTVVDGGTAHVLDGTGSKWGSAATHGNIVVQRLSGLAAGAHTIVMTLAAIDGGSALAIFGGWTITSPDLPLVVLVNSPLSPALPVTTGGAPHSPITTSDLNTLNAAFATVTAGFSDGQVVTADIAGALTAASANVAHTVPNSGYASDDLHLNAHGHAIAAKAVLTAIRTAPLPGYGRQAAMGLVMRQVGGPLEPALQAGWSTVGAAWFGTDRAGNTVLRFQVAKSSAGVFLEEIFALPPGMGPDGFITLTGVSWASGFGSANGAAVVGVDSSGSVKWMYGDPTTDLEISASFPANGLGF